MTLHFKPNRLSQFHTGPVWERFEDMRVGASEKLRLVCDGSVGILRIKRRQYRLMSEDDYQTLYGMASELERLQKDFDLIFQAANVVVENDTEASRKLLTMTAMRISESVSIKSIDGSMPYDFSEDHRENLDDDGSISIPIR